MINCAPSAAFTALAVPTGMSLRLTSAAGSAAASVAGPLRSGLSSGSGKLGSSLGSGTEYPPAGARQSLPEQAAVNATTSPAPVPVSTVRRVVGSGAFMRALLMIRGQLFPGGYAVAIGSVQPPALRNDSETGQERPRNGPVIAQESRTLTASWQSRSKYSTSTRDVI